MIDPWRHWARWTWLSRLLWPLGLVYCALMRLRRAFYRHGWGVCVRIPAPVVIVGNVTVGGTGKTPFVLWLAGILREAGWHPGIVSRGYGGRGRGTQVVTAVSDARLVGDEALLLARRAGVPVVVDRDRARGARRLIALGCDVIVADDGLQHYRLRRDIEIGVLDGERRFGNAACLPAGPLREPLARWAGLDFRVTQGPAGRGEWSMRLRGGVACHVVSGTVRPLADLGRVHAVAGIGNPGRFFAHLRAQGVEVVAHPFADHHNYTQADLDFPGDDPVVMTEKDAVKCARPGDGRWWYVPVDAAVDPALAERILGRLNQIKEQHGQAAT
ncbi:MAG: tetraacyldisaccharide 4'-kinase [Gammaproteobacteria bacterium]|nr:tetraacyldisaccharide 4'-kinase [Gammaproteobacteria bacterium]